MKKENLLKESGYVNFIIEYEEDSHMFNFKLYNVISWIGDNEVDETELYCEGLIKWDGCSHVTMGEEGYLHLCGVGYWKEHCIIMEKLYKFAQSKITKMAEDEIWI